MRLAPLPNVPLQLRLLTRLASGGRFGADAGVDGATSAGPEAHEDGGDNGDGGDDGDDLLLRSVHQAQFLNASS